MVRPRLRPRARAPFLVFIGSLLLAAGAALVYPPAGLLVAGLACVLSGLFLVDAEGARESRSARPQSPR